MFEIVKRNHFFAVVSIYFGLSFSGFAQDFKEPNLLLDAKYIVHGFSDVTKFYQKWDTYDYLLASTFASTTYFLAQNKKEIQARIPADPNSADQFPEKWFMPLGHTVYSPVAAGLFYANGVLFESDRERMAGILLMKSYIFTGMLTILGQFIFAEERPEKGGEMHYFKFPKVGHGVAGHPALAAAWSGPINKQYLQIKEEDTAAIKILKYGGKVLVYGAPLVTAYSRLHDHSHYAWGVLLGVGIGFGVGEIVANCTPS